MLDKHGIAQQALGQAKLPDSSLKFSISHGIYT